MTEAYIEDFKLPCDLRVEYSRGTNMDDEPTIIIEKVEAVFPNVTVVDGKRYDNDIAMDVTHFMRQADEWAIVDHILEDAWWMTGENS